MRSPRSELSRVRVPASVGGPWQTVADHQIEPPNRGEAEADGRMARVVVDEEIYVALVLVDTLLAQHLPMILQDRSYQTLVHEVDAVLEVVVVLVWRSIHGWRGEVEIVKTRSSWPVVVWRLVAVNSPVLCHNRLGRLVGTLGSLASCLRGAAPGASRRQFVYRAPRPSSDQASTLLSLVNTSPASHVDGQSSPSR